MKYVYLLAHPFSGSTLLAFLLGSHPEIATVGEMGIANGVDAGDFQCSCGAPIGACRFWKRVKQRMKEEGHDFDVGKAHLRFRATGRYVCDLLLRAGPRGGFAEATREAGFRLVAAANEERRRLQKRNRDFARIVMELQGASTFLDISKRPNRLLHLETDPNLDVHVIHLLRDFRGVAYSCHKNLELGLADGARSWVEAVRYAERLRARFSPDRWTALRLEDLCHRPDEVLRKLHDFIGIRPDQSFYDFRAYENHIIGNRMRLGSSSSVRLDEKWRKVLTGRQLRSLERIAARVGRRLGYESGL